MSIALRLPTAILTLVMVIPLGFSALAQAVATPPCDASVFGGLACDAMPEAAWRRRGDDCRGRRGSVGTLFQWRDGPLANAPAQTDEPLVTDRPDFTEASSVVGLGVLQIESGYTYTYDDEGNSRSIGHTYPETLLRYGVLADWLELRVAWSYGQDDVNGIDDEGADDLYLGFKIGLTAQEGVLPEMALIPQMTVPTGGGDRSADEVLAGLNWVYSWDITDAIATGGSTQFNRALDEATDDGYTQWAQSWTVAVALTDRIGGYTEYFGFYPSGADTALTEHYFNGGFTFLVNNDLQLDVRGGTGLNDAADDYFFGTGLSIRLR